MSKVISSEIKEMVDTFVMAIYQAKIDKSRKRSFPTYLAKEIKKYARLVGEITWASNDLHQMLSLIFGRLLGDARPTVAFAVWNSIRTDSAQREMLIAAAKNELRDKRRLLSQVVWVTNAAGRISAIRNDAVHTAMFPVVTANKSLRMDASFLAPSARAERLNKARYRRLFPLLRGDLIELKHYAAALCARLHPVLTSPAPLPRRPKLRSLESLELAKSPKPQKAGRRVKRKPQLTLSPA